MKNMKDFRGVPVPARMEKLDRDRRGYPIPVVVFRNEAGEPFFTVNDEESYLRCVEKRLCSICGDALEWQRHWFAGGLRSAFHPAGVFIDSPVHFECGRYAMKVCPYLATPQYADHQDEGRIEKMQQKTGVPMIVDPTLDPAKPAYFAFVRSSGYRLTPDPKSPRGFYLKPIRPYAEVELWKHGAMAPPDFYESIVRKAGGVLLRAEGGRL